MNTDAEQRCQLCADSSPRYDWGLVCCLSRFVAGQPTQARRRMWLDRVRATTGAKAAESVGAMARDKYRILKDFRLGNGPVLRGTKSKNAK